MVRQKDHKRIRLFDFLEEMQIERDSVGYEEEWEELVMNVAEEEKRVKATEGEVWGGWRDAVADADRETRRRLTRLLRDAEEVAGRMMDIVEEERELADKEKRERKHSSNEEKWKLKKERWDAEGIKWVLPEE